MYCFSDYLRLKQKMKQGLRGRLRVVQHISKLVFTNTFNFTYCSSHLVSDGVNYGWVIGRFFFIY